MKVNIRRPKKQDIEPLKILFDETIKEIFERENIQEPEMMEEEIKEKYTFLMEDLSSKGKDRYFLLATVDGKIVGTVAWGKSNRLITESTQGRYDDVLEIGTVYVHPKYQKMGIGMKMMQAMYITLLSKGETEFCLDSGYKSAQAIWTKTLGEPARIDENKWGENNHHMIWYKKLEDINISL